MPQILDDIARMHRFVHAQGLGPALKTLHRPRLARSLAAILADWSAIFAAFAAVLACGWPVVPFALLIIGNRQRALGNLLHDAAHGSLGAKRGRADLLARLLLFAPLWNAVDLYRREHFAHHRRLGEPGADADFIHREADMGKPWFALLWRHLANPAHVKGALLAHLLRAEPAERARMLAWWAGLILALASLVSLRAALDFAALWFAARLLVFHPITMFREISDHAGLKPGTLIGFSRNTIAPGLFAALIHPHHNGYHLVHHLNPGMPWHALPRAHALLLAWPEYAAATHCASYAALLRSWTRSASLRRQQRGERGAVHLAMRGQWQLVEKADGLRDHVAG